VYNIKILILATMFIFSNRVTQKHAQGIMSDKDSSERNFMQSFPRREPKIILQRAEDIFPALKESLVSVFVFVRTEE
jgi:hypothetical protein